MSGTNDTDLRFVAQAHNGDFIMHTIIYIVGLVVVIGFILSLLGLL